jgi:hypothetical protein
LIICGKSYAKTDDAVRGGVVGSEISIIAIARKIKHNRPDIFLA